MVSQYKANRQGLTWMLSHWRFQKHALNQINQGKYLKWSAGMGIIARRRVWDVLTFGLM